MDEIGNSLEQLWISYNQIEKLEGLNPCIKLHTLSMTNNRIKIWDELSKLAALPEIKSVSFVNNPIYGDMPNEESHPMVYKRLPNIENIDGKTVSGAVKKAADELD